MASLFIGMTNGCVIFGIKRKVFFNFSLWRSELTDEAIDSLCAVITQNDTIKVLE